MKINHMTIDEIKARLRRLFNPETYTNEKEKVIRPGSQDNSKWAEAMKTELKMRNSRKPAIL